MKRAILLFSLALSLLAAGAQAALENPSVVGQVPGRVVVTVESGGPAAKAGLLAGQSAAQDGGQSLAAAGDIIVAIDGIPVKRFDDLINYLATETSVGDAVTLTVIRDGRQSEVTVTLEERPGNR